MMNKLTAKKCLERIDKLKTSQRRFGISIFEEEYLEALEIALPILEQQEAKKKVSLREGIEASRKLIAELGGYNFEALRAEQQEKGDGWIYWGGGECPVKGDTVLETRWSDGDTVINRADDMMWAHHAKHCNLIAYRVVQQERERGEEE
ncbi:hypothetical protein [Pantoea sp.]|uniref:hypothetical protein n=1 Tax=Pantoea sp. TaxID=69393 RepID=UPI00291249B1|nr:hypothetical protein [Pantoea sp.]MDU5476110.1 hypothetical protein [Pantoea sp.]